MKTFTVTWSITLMADSAVLAAVRASEIMQDHNSNNTEFRVQEEGHNATIAVDIADLHQYFIKQEVPR